MKLKTIFTFETDEGHWLRIPKNFAVIEASEEHIIEQCVKAQNLDDLPPIIERVVVNEAKDLLANLELEENYPEYTGNFGFEMEALGWWENFKLKLSF